jgi:alkaline phosphatase
MKTKVIFVVLIFLFAYADSIGEWSGDTIADKWRIQAKNNIDAVLKKRRNTNIAKNILFYLGDGMGKNKLI